MLSIYRCRNCEGTNAYTAAPAIGRVGSLPLSKRVRCAQSGIIQTTREGNWSLASLCICKSDWIDNLLDRESEDFFRRQKVELYTSHLRGDRTGDVHGGVFDGLSFGSPSHPTFSKKFTRDTNSKIARPS